MKACARCGSSARLRFDRARDGWVCVLPCGIEPTTARSYTGRAGARRRPHRAPLFGVWWTHESGDRTRATRDQLREATRLWYVHKDIREGRVNV